MWRDTPAAAQPQPPAKSKGLPLKGGKPVSRALKVTELRGITWEHSRGFDPKVATAREYERLHPNVRIVWEQRSLQEFANGPVDDLAQRFDLLVIDHPHMGAVAKSGDLLALDTVGRDEELKRLRAQSLGPSFDTYEYDGHLWALPIDAAAQVASYRPDLLPEPPQTWDEVIELAKAGRVLWPIKPVDALMSFFTLAANRGTPCRNGEPNGELIARDDAMDVLDALKRLADRVPAECLTMNPIQTCERLCTDDRFAYCPLGYGYSTYARSGFRGQLLKFTNIPALGHNGGNGSPGPRGSTLGGTGIAVSSRCTSCDVAIDYAFWVASAETQRTTYFDGGGQPGNAAPWDDDRVNAVASNFFRDTRQTLDLAYVRPRYAGYLELQDKGGDAVNACLAGRATARETADALNTIYRSSH
jgi:multiple sugar transport system substrate-binding protein